MDFSELKSRIVVLRSLLKQNGIRFDGAILFGSRAKGAYRPDSDFDIAIISRDFGKDRFSESSLLNRLAYGCIPYCDAVPVALADYIDPSCISPILHEIKKDGLRLL